MIVDFDVHHGNGTQDLFYGDPSVLFIDMHQHDVWPGTGQAGERGVGEGEGCTINVPLPGEQRVCSAAGGLIGWHSAVRMLSRQRCAGSGMHLLHAAGVGCSTRSMLWC